MREETRALLRAVAREHLATAGGGHGFDHTVRVVASALRLAEAYPEADRDQLEAAAWLHDVGRGVTVAKGHGHADRSAAVAEGVLLELGFPRETVCTVCEAIADHSFSGGRSPRSLIGALLQDADRLDAVGAVGIARTFAEGAGRQLYHPDDPWAESPRALDDNRYTLDHFFAKLLALPATMRTPEARAEAARRVCYMRDFLQEFARKAGMSVTPATHPRYQGQGEGV